MKKEAVLGIMLPLLLISMLTLTFNIQQVKASPLVASDFMVELTTPTEPWSIGVNSTGAIYYGDERANLFVSVDHGTTWTCVFNSINLTGNFIYNVFVDSNDNVWFAPRGNGDVWKYNGTCTMMYDTNPPKVIWHIDEHPNGTIYFNLYTTGYPYAYGSDDVGETWYLAFNATALDPLATHHVHSIKVNPDNWNIYVAVGDNETAHGNWRYDNDTATWEDIGDPLNTTNPLIDFWFKDNYVYLGHDTNNFLCRMPYGGNASLDSEGLMYTLDWRDEHGIVDYAAWGHTLPSGIMVYTTAGGKIWASWDGLHWVMLYSNKPDFIEIRDCPERKTLDNALVFPDGGSSGKILKFYVDADVLKGIFFNNFTSVTGDLVTVERIVRNGTEYLDLSEYGVESANVTLIGEPQDNIVSNGTFEYADGDGQEFAGWKMSDKRYGEVHSDTTYKVSGSNSMNVTNKYALIGVVPPEFGGAYSGNNPVEIWQPKISAIIIVRCYVRSNETQTDKFRVRCEIKNSTYETTLFSDSDLTTSWALIETYFVLPYWSTHYRIMLTSLYAETALWFDEFQLEHYSFAVYDDWGYDRQYIEVDPSSFNETHAETTNPSITIEGQTYSHSGELANGTSSTTWSLGTIAGIIPFNTTVYGSGVVKVRVQGERSVTLSNAFIRNEVSTNLFNGTYYGTPSITTSENYIIVLTDRNSSLTQASLATYTLILTISGYSGLSGVTRVYCGDKGEPRGVCARNGTLSWSCNATTKMLTLNVAHDSSANILIDWRIPGDVNGDGIVDIFDIGSISAHWYPGPPIGPLGYDVCADINYDLAVDVFDIGIVCDQWGQTNPTP